MNSKHIKAVLCAYYRFKHQCGIIATEAGMNNADFITFKKGKMIEVEIKTARGDLNVDFKKPKHRVYTTCPNIWTPHLFYFAVPEEMVEYAVAKVIGKPYGVMRILPPEAKQTFTAYSHRDYLDRRMKQIEKAGGVINSVEDHTQDDRYLIKYSVVGAVRVMDRLKIIKRAKDLHHNPISQRVVNVVIKRMGSELANLYQKIIKE